MSYLLGLVLQHINIIIIYIILHSENMCLIVSVFNRVIILILCHRSLRITIVQCHVQMLYNCNALSY